MIYFLTVILVFIMAELLFRKIVIIGRENIPQSRGYIIAGNHVSYFDPVAIGYALWIKGYSRLPLNYLAKAQVGKSSFFRWFLKQYNVYFVERGKGNRETLEKALDLLENGKSVLIFPQGSTIPEKQKVTSGVGFLAVKSQKPILPVRVEITGYKREKGFWPLFVMILKWFFGHGKIKVKFGSLIKCDSQSDRWQITNRVMDRIKSL